MITAEAAPAVAFNDWAKTQGWDSHCDPALNFRSPMLAGLLAVWRQQTSDKRMPPRGAMNARVLKPYLPHLMIYERVAGGRYRVRLIGTRIAEAIGDIHGRLVDEVVPAHLLGRWQRALDMTLAEECPLRFDCCVDFRDLQHLRAEMLLAPLGEPGEPATMILAGVVFASNKPPVNGRPSARRSA